MNGPDSPLAGVFAISPSLETRLPGVARAAASEATVLVLGEPGCGRSSMARALHAASPRSVGPLEEVDPGSVPSSLFESELFGHVAGAFTGAESARQGRVARAEAGSLLIDHVEEIPLASQPKLLRLLAERRYAPLGGREVEADVRFLAVGAADLPRRVSGGAFREDLFFRLEVLTFIVPPVRERREDIGAMLDFFLADLGERFGRGRLELSDAARAWMDDYGWPGNLREMRNVLERAIILGDEGPLDPPQPSGAEERPQSLRELEREHIVRALAYARGHQGRAAELLGISRKSLWEKRRRYGIP